ncbi:hypothetical protein F5B20DRAFT_203331 [Whalleya microplaca]|nr:hypothetical protein F5B20DRAFT_203331 [Whalleya microplaca]
MGTSPSKVVTSCFGHRAFVYDATKESYAIKADARVRTDYDAYYSFDLPPRLKNRSDSWDLFLDKANALAARPENPPKEGTYVAGLKLDKMNGWGKLLRRTGALNTGYILRP